MIVIHVLQEVHVKMVSSIIHLVFIFRKLFFSFLLKIEIGYWLDGNLINNVKPYRCFPYGSSCLASNISMNTICEEGYLGPLCQTCMKNYAKYGGLQCSSCYSKNVNYLVFILSFLAFTIFLLIYLK